MGAATFVLEGATPAEVRRKRAAKLREGEDIHLYLEKESKIQKTPKGDKYFIAMRLHS